MVRATAPLDVRLGQEAACAGAQALAASIGGYRRRRLERRTVPPYGPVTGGAR